MKTQEEQLKALLSEPNKLGIYWASLEGGSHEDTWMHAWRYTYAIEWMLKQTKKTEVKRARLVLTGKYPKGTYEYNTPLPSGQ